MFLIFFTRKWYTCKG